MGQSSVNTTGAALGALLNDPTSPEAWQAFVKRYAPEILGWCLERGAQAADAEDVRQEVLLKLAARIRSFPYDPARGSFRAWLRALTRNTWTDLQRRVRRCAPLPQDWEDPHARPEEAVEWELTLEVYEEAKRRVRGRVAGRTWRAFELLVTGECAGARVAAELRMSVSAVFRAKWAVKALLAEEVRRLERPGSRNKEGRRGRL
jgi:RNA polymerase sigma-70 factor (ECF subfamily)